MERKSEFGVRNVLIITTSTLLLLVMYVMIKWYLELRKRTSRIFHMVRNYKRPSYLPVFGHAFKFVGSPTQIHQTITQLCSEYGPNFVIWLVDKVIVIVGKPEDVQKMLQSSNCLEKGDMYRFTRDMFGTGIFSAPVSIWRNNRRIVTRTFHTTILDGYQPIFCNSATLLADEILPNHLNKKDVDWYMLFSAANLEVITQTAMGVKIDTQRTAFPFGKWIEYGTRAIFIRMIQILYHPDIIFFRTNLGKQLRHCKEKMMEFTNKIVTERKNKFREDLLNGNYQPVFDEGSNKPVVKKAFLDCLIELDYRGTKFTDEELRDEVNGFFIGGTDTTSVTSCFIFLMMGMHPDIQKQVYEEVMEVIGPDRLPTVQDLNELHFTERCILETMRLFATVPIILRLNTGEDIQLSDGVIPQGASCAVSFFNLHRNDLYWKDPLKYDPDRFSPEEVAKRHPYTFVPFSGGLRGCLGKRFALMNLKSLLSIVIRKYKINCDAYKSIEDIELKNQMVLRPVNGWKFTMERRKMSA